MGNQIYFASGLKIIIKVRFTNHYNTVTTFLYVTMVIFNSPAADLDLCLQERIFSFHIYLLLCKYKPIGQSPIIYTFHFI